MGKNFKKIKRQIALNSLLSSILIGIAIALIGISAVMFYCKLTGNEFDNLYYVVGGAVAVVLSAVTFVLLMPSDKRLAKTIDEKYSLNEKTRTAIAFRNVNNPFMELQREDADEILGSRKKQPLRLKQLICASLVLAISLGCMAGAFILPAKADNGEDPISEFDKQWLLTAIDELLNIVTESFMTDSLKVKATDELLTLKGVVEDSVLMSEMKEQAVDTVVNINRALANTNSAAVIGPAFAGSTKSVISELGEALASLSGGASKKALSNLGDYLDSNSADEVGFVADELGAYLSGVSVRADDPVVILLKTLVGAMRATSESGSTAGLSDTVDDNAAILSNEVIIQNVNKVTINIVTTKLCNLFGITEADLTDEAPDVQIEVPKADNGSVEEDDSDIEEPDDTINSGGLGTGETIYGSDDLVYDPDTGTYRPYGEILDSYYAKVNELIVDGKLDDDVKKAAENYFGILYTGPSSTGN